MTTRRRSMPPDRFAQWKATRSAQLEARGYQRWSGAPLDHPYVITEPTSRFPTTQPACTTKAELARAIRRATELGTGIERWIPLWMHTALFPEDVTALGETIAEGSYDALPASVRSMARRLVIIYRYESDHSHAALDAMARLGGAHAVLTYLDAWYHTEPARP